MTSCTRNLARAWGVCGRIESPKPSVAGAALGSNERKKKKRGARGSFGRALSVARPFPSARNQ